MSKNTEIGTIIAMKNSPQNSSPTGGLVKISPESTQLAEGAQVPITTERPCICIEYYQGQKVLTDGKKTGCNQALWAIRCSYLVRSSSWDSS